MTRGERPRATGVRAHASAWQLALQRPAQEPPREPFLLPSVVRQRREDRRPGGERGRFRGSATSALAAAALRSPLVTGTEAPGVFIFCYGNFHTQKHQDKEPPHPASAAANLLSVSFHFPVFWG